MKRRQYRVCCETEYTDMDGCTYVSVHEDRRKYASRKRAETRALIYTAEPWRAYEKEADDHWCSHGMGGCGEGGGRNESVECDNPERTCREYWDGKRIEHKWTQPRAVWIEFRWITRWEKTTESEVAP